MNVQHLIADLKQRDVVLSVVEDKLVVDAPKGVLTSDLTDQLPAFIV